MLVVGARVVTVVCDTVEAMVAQSEHVTAVVDAHRPLSSTATA